MSDTERNGDALIEVLIRKLREFAQARDWDRYHSPKNITMALSVEVAELMEILQWKTEAESRDIMSTDADRVKDEVGDITLYLLMLCDKLGLNPLAVAFEKMAANELKYPVGRCRGSFVKYSQHGKWSRENQTSED